jgi:divalent metal cation (Fe/Co/Zn/Cd) transporter
MYMAITDTHSVALIAFGFDTMLEIGASTIVIWELNGNNAKRQKMGLKLLSISFFLLGIYLITQCTFNLVYPIQTVTSTLGMVWLVLTFVLMALLALLKYQIGKKLNNPVLLTEGRVTMVDAVLAGVVLTSMLIIKYWGWTWTDTAGGLILTAYCFWEAKHGWLEAKS